MNAPTSTPDPRTRAALSNGRLLPRTVDGRSAEARRFRDLYRDFAAGTPEDRAQAHVDARLRSLVGVTMALERIGARQASGEPAEVEELTRLVHAQARLLESLSLAPRARTPAQEDPEDTEALFARVRDPDRWRKGR